MKPVVHKKQSLAIVYDASRMGLPGAEYFNAEYWASRNALRGQAIGRGSAWFIDAPFGPVVLRRYLRGGWVAKVSRERYFSQRCLDPGHFGSSTYWHRCLSLDYPFPDRWLLCVNTVASFQPVQS